MKNANIRKINTLGTVSYVISIIVIAVLIIGIIGTLIGGFLILGLNDNAFNINGNINAEISVDESNANGFTKFLLDSGAVELVHMEEEDLSIDDYGFDMHWKVDQTESGESAKTYTIDGAIDRLNNAPLKYTFSAGLFFLALILGLILVSAFFGKNLARKLSKCESPFHEDVIRAMKHFAYSLIPFGIASLTANGIGILGVLSVLVVFLFVFTFSYGAELQKEADETV